MALRVLPRSVPLMPLGLRLCITAWTFLFCALRGNAEVQDVRIDHDHIVNAAEALAEKPYRPPGDQLPQVLRELSYDDYRRIRFVDERALWTTDNLPFRVHFFHPGNLFRRTVGINEFVPGFSQRIPFVRNYFDYHDLSIPGRLPGSLEYAGFRVLYPLNAPERLDEIVSFLGASYYRALARDQRYGMSARGLAINFGGPGGEEFPDFVEFWLGKPAGGATSLRIHALLDSPSATGAFTYQVIPGEDTVIQAQVTLFLRQDIAVLGLAPLTSMFWFGEGSPHHFGDFRPEVHDSDGLLVAVDPDTRVWRPLENPHAPRVTAVQGSAGFGLLQRDRQYYNYEDTEARYDKRPSVWVRPIGNWPAGHVRLLEFQTADEYADNVVAAFVPNEMQTAGTRLDYAYEQSWTSRPTQGGPAVTVRSTRRSVHFERNPARTKFVVDFEPSGLAEFAADAPVTADVTVPAPAQLIRQHLFRNDIDGSWRLTLVLEAPDDAPPVEVSARLMHGAQPLSETWMTTWER
jgi:periplasmic glucans biosynthesis protein